MTEYLFPFEKLDVWQLSLDLADMVFGLIEKIPDQGKHVRLISQMEAASASPAQNIAEGRGRQYKKEFIQFLYIARGSVFEVVTLNEIFQRRNLFSIASADEAKRLCERIDRKLNGLINSLRGKKRKSTETDEE